VIQRLLTRLMGFILCLCSVFSWASSDALPAWLPPVVPALENKPAQAKKQERRLSWHFVNADIRTVTQVVARMMGRNIFLSPSVHGTVTFVTPKALPVSLLFKAYESLLASLHYTLVSIGPGLQKVVPTSEAMQYTHLFEGIENGGVVTALVPLRRVKAYTLVSTLRPLLDEWGSINAQVSNNALLITGSQQSVKTVKALALALDEKQHSVTRLVPCHFAEASQVADVMKAMMEGAATHGEYNAMTVTIDRDSNTVILHGRASDMKEKVSLINHLDELKAHGLAATAVIPLNYLKADVIAPLLVQMMTGKKEDPTSAKPSKVAPEPSRLAIIAESSNNALMVHASAHDMTTIRQLIKQLDVRPDQVLIEAVVVQMDQTEASHLGVEWQWGIGSAISTTASNGIGFIKSGSMANILHLLKSHGTADILATPSIMVLNNKKATISSGKNIPITSGNYTSTSSSSSSSSPYVQDGVYNQVDRKDVTLTLEVTPQITPHETVRLVIKQTDDSLGTNESDESETNLNPTIYTNNIDTSVLVNSGDVLVLGGLSSHELRHNIEKIPVLGDLPLLGRLFQYHTSDSEKRDLMVFIRPIILHTKADGVSLTKRAYDTMHAQTALMESRLSIKDQTKRPVSPIWPSLPSPKHTKGKS